MRVSVLIAHNPLVFFVLGKLRYELPNAEMERKSGCALSRLASAVSVTPHTVSRAGAGNGKRILRFGHQIHTHGTLTQIHTQIHTPSTRTTRTRNSE